MVNDTDKIPPSRQVRSREEWSPDKRIRGGRESTGPTGSDFDVHLRRAGLHEATVAEWRTQTDADGLGVSSRRTKERECIRELQRAFGREDNAQEATAALVVIASGVPALWRDDDDATMGRSGT